MKGWGPKRQESRGMSCGDAEDCKAELNAAGNVHNDAA